ncbi:O-Antigen ligase [Marininema mesophilum]|uniref:O-Antigen ligase n=1 Tax=Marininema mesophilum TaxID=1048340 RepID=A0A1H2WEU3_9BACL|nr:O-antigen ligase family protein [Marininema mesophilum]SDW79038.1 O-Antigen ligase [Marininema mesophilum]
MVIDPRRSKIKERAIQFLFVSILFSPVIPVVILLVMGLTAPVILKGSWRPFGLPEKIFIGFVALSTISWVLNPYLLLGWLPVAVLPISFFGLYAVLAVWMKRGLQWSWKHFEKLYTTFWLAGLYSATVTILQRLSLIPMDNTISINILWGFYRMQSEGPRSIGPSFNSNLAAALLMCLALLSIYATSLARNRWEKIAAFAIFFYYCVAIWCTGSRGAWMGLVIGLLVQVWMTGKRKRTVALFLGLVTIALILVTNMSLIPRDDSLLLTIAGRLNVWEDSFSIFLGNWVFGVLPIHFGYLIEQVSGTYLFHAHNVFLGIAVEYGVIGLVLFLILIVVSTARARRWRKTASERKEKRLAGVLISMVVALLGHGMYDYPIINPQIGVIFMTAIIVINAQYERRCLEPSRYSREKEIEPSMK